LAEIGNVLGNRYRLLELLGQGGMATIYRARDSQLERDVAIKVLRAEYGRDPDFSSRFRQEAQAAAALNHPNVVAVYDYGQDEAGPYIVMELVDGEDLASVIRRTGALPPRQAARIAAEVARALAAAHARGFVHRDVKPGNVLVGRDGRVKVADFGIARAVAEAQMTLPGTTLGSVHYFSPEQARGEQATTASDIYALGIVLFELLTGRRPWEGDSAASIAMARLSGPVPSPGGVRSGVPPALDSIVQRALSREPAGRFPTAAAMADALDAFLADRAPEGARGAAVPAAAAGAAGAVAGAAGAGAAGAAGAGAVGAAAAGAASPTGATVASGVARPNPPRVPYAQDAYADSSERYRDPRAQRRGAGPYEEEPEGGTSPWVWVSAVLALAILAVAGFLVFRLISGPGTAAAQQVTVPNFAEKLFDVAKGEAAELKLELVVANTQATDQPDNTIVSQDPGPGSMVDEGATVRVVVDAGEGQTSVPDLRNKTQAEALQLITDAGLKLGQIAQGFSNTVPVGSVIRQSHQPGVLVTKGTAIDLTLSQGPRPSATPAPTPTPTPPPTPTPTPAPINVGDYQCVTLEEATDQIEADGFNVGTITPQPAGYPGGSDALVIDQDPNPGAKRKPGTKINLTVYDPASYPFATCPPP
jgi:beta-lactam-binding protein with PASTA domain/tRNA A-37 threonylcarbamoyl transferase component Bud32